MAGKQPDVVIIGGGFGGLNAARKLAKAPVQITLIDRRNYHLFQPLLYQVATAALNPSDIAYPIRSALRKQKNCRVLLGDARAVDVENKRVILVNGEVEYDYLILATGVRHSYFGKEDEWSEHAPGLKTVGDALFIRRKVFLAYEQAERESDPEAQRTYQTFVVVGAGPTGVELAGALAEIGIHTLAKDFRTIDPTEVRVVLLEGRDRVLPEYPEKLSASAKKQLEKLGVEVRTDSMVTRIDESGVEVGGSERIEARTVLWAAGVRASSIAQTLGVPLDRAGRVLVEPDLSVPGHPEIFVIGDLATVECNGKQVPGVAQGAIQGGRHTAKNLVRELRGKERLPFRYNDKGSMATVGRSKAVVDMGRFKFSGFFAWLFWWMIHVVFLIGFRNRVLVMFHWAWSWLTFQRGARLIVGPTKDLPRLGGGGAEAEAEGEAEAEAEEEADADADGRSVSVSRPGA